jgi:hypothetical protein
MRTGRRSRGGTHAAARVDTMIVYQTTSKVMVAAWLITSSLCLLGCSCSGQLPLITSFL